MNLTETTHYLYPEGARGEHATQLDRIRRKIQREWSDRLVLVTARPATAVEREEAYRDVAQSGSAPALEAGGRQFDSGRPDS